MKKKILLIFIILIFLATCGIIYLNKVVLPTKIKSLIIQGIKEATQKRVTLDSAQFNIFKGLVLRDLVVYDGPKAIISIKEGSCTFLILPIFKKNIIFPVIKLKSPEIFLERRLDNTLNLTQLFPQRKEKEGNFEFNILVNKIIITGARINFQDASLTPVFTKTIDNLGANIFFSLPASVKFNLKCGISASQRIEIGASGDFNMAKNLLTVKISITNLSPDQFLPYYQNLNIHIPQGLIDALADFELKDNIASIQLNAKIKDLILSKDKISAKTNSNIIADISYDFENKQLTYRGNGELFQSNVAGLDFIGDIDDIRGVINFDNKGVSSDKIKAFCFGSPFEAKVSLSDFSNPSINFDASDLNLDFLQKILKEKLKVVIPADIKGKADLSIAIEKKVSDTEPTQISGRLMIANAIVKLDNIDSPIEEVAGGIEFNAAGTRWSGLNFKYQGTPYSTSGSLTNFATPNVQLTLSSRELSLESSFVIGGKLVEFTQLKGKYLNSEFSLSGQINLSNPQTPQAQVSGTLNIDLKDIKEPRIKPGGVMYVKFNVSGNINKFKSCAIDAEFRSPSVSALGLKSTDFLLIYKQADGILEVPSLRLSLYDGIATASAAMNLNTEHLPYWINLDIKDIKIEKLKLDTPASQKDIAGTIQAQAKLNGFSGDISKLSGQGSINISEGKLWQLNLFQGIGKLIFAKDFANIIFNEGYCGFVVRDKTVFTDSLKLKSNLVELTGSAKIGFDSSVDATIEIHVLDQMAPLTSTLKDVATAIIGESDVFGRIKISGSLQEPKYKFQPAIVDIIKGLKGFFRFP